MVRLWYEKAIIYTNRVKGSDGSKERFLFDIRLLLLNLFTVLINKPLLVAWQGLGRYLPKIGPTSHEWFGKDWMAAIPPRVLG